MGLTRRQFIKQTGMTAGMLPLARYGYAADELDGFAAAVDNVSDGQRLHSVCGLCRAKCLIDGVVESGRLIRIEGNPLSPVTDGKICARGLASIKMLYDPDRLKYPLKRIGKRGEGKWARISWGEAIDAITLNLEKTMSRSGPNALSLFHSGPSSKYIKELFSELGCRNINDSSQELCRLNREIAYTLTFGKSPSDAAAGVFNGSKCIVLFGSHLGENVQVPVLRSYIKAKGDGARLIVIDPRVSTVASKADYHLAIRPGTDTALLLGWLKYIIEDGLYNKQVVEQRIEDLDRLEQQLKDYRLRDIADICDLKVNQIKRTAELIASSAPHSTIYPGQFSGWYGNDVQRLRAQAILSALIDPEDSFLGDHDTKNVTISDQREALSSSVFNKINSGEISIIGCWGQNPFHSSVNPYRVKSAFLKADFVFTCDIYPSETSLYSDIILPEATFLERSDGIEILDTGKEKIVATRQAMVEPRFASKDPYSIVKQLSSRLGKGENFYFNSVSKRIEREMQELGVSPLELKQKGFASLDHEGKSQTETIESQIPAIPAMTLFSSELQERGAPPLPLFEPVQLPPQGYSRLICGRTPVHTNSTTHNVDWLNEESSLEPELWLNTLVARKLKINNGETLYLENQDGIRSINPVRVKVTPGIRVDAVYMAHGFGQMSPFMTKAFNKGVSDSSLISRTLPDPVSGVRGTRGNFVRFVKNGQTLSIPSLDNPPDILKQYQKWWLDSFGSFEKGHRRKMYV